MLISSGQKKILEVFLKDPFKEIHLREISRFSKSSLTNVDSSMRSFVKNEMFKRREVAHATFFKPDLENEEVLKLFEFLEMDRRKTFYAKNKTIARLIKKYTDNVIERSNKRIQMVILFGSVARGEWTKESDIDILTVVSDKESDITDILNRSKIDVSPLLEISPICTTIQKFKEGVNAKNGFYDDLWSDRVVLYNDRKTSRL